jgi:2-methylisocitrate lyase-like PEP mutase family enzyme
MTTQEEKARRFRALHRGDILVLPNAWDAASARIFELAGARAVATTSSGLAASLGYPDGEKIGRALVIGAVERIIAAVDVPVSVDIEAGYGPTARDAAETVEAVLRVGGVGVNVEDGMADPSVLVEKIVAIREVSAARGVPLFINARTDVYLAGRGEAAERFEEAVRRLRAYEAAGADGLFVPGVGDEPTIAKLLREIHLPLNILATAGVPPVRELARIGVSRVSVGGGPMRAALALTRRIAHELLHEGTYSAFLNDTIAHAEVNRMFGTRERE